MPRGLALLLVLLPACPTAAADGTHAAVVRTLAAPELAGRGAGTAGERDAAALIAGWFETAGLQPGPGRDGSWLQSFALPDDAAGARSRNVLGVVRGNGDLADRWIIVGAHLDHLGRVRRDDAGVPAAGDYYPGAGDNASGIAVLVHLARSAPPGAAADDAPRRSLLLCAFGAEECGLLGSAHLASDLPVDRDRIDAMVNLDAVGNLRGGPLHVAGMQTCDRFPDLVSRAAGALEVRSQDPVLLRSDHASFLAVGLPSLFLFTGAYPEMNSPADSLGVLDVDGLAQVAQVAERLVDALREAGGRFEFRPPPAPATGAGAGNRSTWFGTAPDFAGGDVVGYAIGGTVPRGPAALAGLQAGDLLVRFGGLAVTDLATFTTALRRHDPGDVVDVEVVRGGRSLRFHVTLGDRARRPR